jgi:hypothetical protein
MGLITKLALVVFAFLALLLRFFGGRQRARGSLAGLKRSSPQHSIDSDENIRRLALDDEDL